MRIEILGSGGALPTPRPGCQCRMCVQARERGVPYSRTGPSLFVHGPDVVIDTPEESKQQLNRAGIGPVPSCLYSHWHPDHTAGLRVFEALNWDLWRWPPRSRRTDVYLPEQVARDLREKTGAWTQLAYLERVGLVRVAVLADGDTLTLGGVRIRPFRLAQDYVYAFLFEGDGRRALVAPDELLGWTPPADLRGVDLAVIPMGIVKHDPFTGERRIAEEHPVLQTEATFAQTLDVVRALGAERTILTHVEEPDQLGYDDLLRLEARLRGDGLNVTFAYDGLVVDV